MKKLTHTNTHTYTYTHKHINFKKEEILPFAKPWMKLEIFLLSEISQAQKDKCYMTSLTGKTWEGGAHRHRSEWWLEGGRHDSYWVLVTECKRSEL
jgi:hypothetical protein